MAVKKFSDLTDEELQKVYQRAKKAVDFSINEMVRRANVAYKKEYGELWKEKGMIYENTL